MASVMSTHLDAGMGAEVEVELCGMCDAHIHRGPSRNVPTSTNLLKENNILHKFEDDLLRTWMLSLFLLLSMEVAVLSKSDQWRFLNVFAFSPLFIHSSLLLCYRIHSLVCSCILWFSLSALVCQYKGRLSYIAMYYRN